MTLAESSKYLNEFACPLAIQSLCFSTSLTISDWAAWVQAIGSVLAVFAAIGIVKFQLDHQRRSTALLEVNRLQAFWTLVYHCRVEMQYFAQAARTGEAHLDAPGGLAPKVAALRAIPIVDIPGAKATIAILTVIEAYAVFQSGIEPEEIGNTGIRFPRLRWVESHANACQDNFEFAERQLRICLEARNSPLPLHGAYTINGQPFPPLDSE